METDLDSRVQYLRGVGPARAARLERLGVRTLLDLLYTLPSRTEDRSERTAMEALAPGMEAVVRGRVTSVRGFGRGGRRGFRVTLTDDTGAVTGTWFRAGYLRERFQKGQWAVFSGRVTVYRGGFTMAHPDFEILEQPDEQADSLSLDRIVPVYRAAEGLSPGLLRKLTHQALETLRGRIPDWLPAPVLEKRGLPGLEDALRSVHFPASEAARDRAMQRLAYEELFLMQVLLAVRRAGREARPKTVGFRLWPRLEDRIRSRLPFDLTRAQERAVSEVFSDMTSDRPMNRLLEGDVGSGKTAVAVAALLACVANKAQAAFLAPTEVLAAQHYLTLRDWLRGSRVRLALLEGGMAGRERDELLERVEDGRVDVVVGTHALLEGDVAFARLGLAVIDEQHKFGVAQRARLIAKGPDPDFLIMTATPIPRTLSLTVFGDLDVSVLDEMPPGRTPPATAWARTPRDEKQALDTVRRELESGRQAFFVYPAIEDSPDLPLRSLETHADRLADVVFPDFPVAVLHGRLPARQKERVMQAFRSGDVAVLASTTVIEVGVDVPNATVMVVENADRFGLAQLHQLRGRIGRGGGASHCFLFARPSSDTARERLQALEDEPDGFRIAEQDLRLRGPGDFFGTRQHGLPPLQCADLVQDLELLQLARKDAFPLVRKDPKLQRPQHQPLLRELLRRFGQHLDIAAVG